MTDLEWINKEIERYKIIIVGCTPVRTDSDKTKEFLKKEIEEYKEKIHYLQQIKTKLKAWEVVAPDLLEGKLVGLSYLLKNDVDKFNKVRKALEVSNDK